jgi:hypothetical protein
MQYRFRLRHVVPLLLAAWCCCVAGATLAEEVLAQEARPQAVSVLFVGDIMLDNGPGHVIASGKDPFAPCATLLRDADFTVGNLECVVGRGGEQILKNYTFRAAQGSVPLLHKYFDAVSLANNHSGDFGPEGLLESFKTLERGQVPYFGAGRNEKEARRPLILERHGRRIALLGFNGYNIDFYSAGDKKPGTAPLLADKVVADIRAARKEHRADIVIPFVHWGEELVAGPTQEQRALARRMIDAGASAVVGAHPHVPQTVDVYRGCPIVYSLGNFVFDYYPVDPPEWVGWTAKLTFPATGPTDLVIEALTLDAAGVPSPVPAADDEGKK